MGGPVPRRILCALLVRPGGVIATDALVEAAWGDGAPPSAERTLVSHVARLRESLAGVDVASPPLVERRGQGYRLVVEPDAVDATRLERAVRDAIGTAPSEAVSSLRSALALWRPPAPFADLVDTAYPAAQAARLTELHGSAVETLITAELDAGDVESAIADAEARLADMPFREQVWALLITALYQQGRQADALDAYERARAKLDEELGVAPGPRLRELHTQVLAQDPALLASVAPSARQCPYRGLGRYDTADADLFVGRERLVDELVGRLVDAHLIVVVGPSGAGKSSLVRAGLVPALDRGALPHSAGWSVQVVQPGSSPLSVMATALAGHPDVLVIDQVEEALLAEDGSSVRAFGDAVLAAVDAGTRVVLVVRADFFGLLAGHPGLARRTGPATVLVGLPDAMELRRIITEPAARVGLQVEPALARLILSDVGDRPGVLPVLSTALVRTWENRVGDVMTVASYRAGGGVTAALERAGEEAWADLASEEQRSACRRLILRLAVNEDGSWVRRWARRSELIRHDDPAAAAALQVLTDHRLIVARADDLGVAHEALLSGWPRLRGWLDDGRAHAVVRERLAVAAVTWDDSDRDLGELYSGARLQAALDTAAANPEDLNPLERTFLRQSADEADRRLLEQRQRADREAHGRRRTRVVAVALAIALTAAIVAIGYALDNQRAAQRAALVADASRVGAFARAGGDYDTSLLLAAQAVALNRSPTTEADLFATLLRGDAVVRTMRASGPVSGVAFTPDGDSVLATSSSSPAGGQVLRRPVAGPATNTSFHVGRYAGGVAVARDGRLVVLAEETLEELDPSDGTVVARGPEIGLNVWALMQGGRVVVSAAPAPGSLSATDVLVWRVDQPNAVARHVRIGAAAVAIAACGPTSACILTDSDRLVRIRLADRTVDASVGMPAGTLVDLAGPGTPTLVASKDGGVVAVAGEDGVVRVVATRTGHVQRLLGGASQDIRVLAFSPDGSRVVGADFATVLVWRTDRDGLPNRYDVHGGRVLSAAWSPDGSTLATGGEDSTIVVLDTTGRRRVGAVLTTALDANTSTLWATPSAFVVAQFDGDLLFVDPADGSIHRAIGSTGSRAPIVTARTGPAGSLLATADQDGVTAIWNLKTHRLLGTVDLPRGRQPYAQDVWVSPDGRTAATIRTGSGAVVFDMATRKVLRRLAPLPAPEAEFNTALQGWTADGHSLLVTRQLSVARSDLLVIDATSGAVKLRVSTGAAWAEEAAADPSGRFIALAGNDGTLRIVDATDGRALSPPLRANDGEVINVSVSPDGRYVSATGSPPRLTVWDTRTFRQVGTALPLDVNASDARGRFAPDGRLVVVSGAVMRVFTIDPDAWLVRACAVAGRTLTRAEFEQVLPGRHYAPACS